MKDGYKLEDTIILNGKVGWVNTGDDADSIIGIQNMMTKGTDFVLLGKGKLKF